MSLYAIDLVKQIESHPSTAPFLDRPWVHLGALPLARNARKRVESEAARVRAKSVRELIGVAARTGDDTFLGPWLLKKAHEALPPPPEPNDDSPRPGIKPAALRSWARRVECLPEVEGRPADLGGPPLHHPSLYWHESVADVLARKSPTWGDGASWRALQDEIVRRLLRQADAVAEGLRVEAERDAARRLPPPEPLLAGPWRRVIALRDALRRTGARPRGPQEVGCELQEDPPAVVYTLAGGSVRLSLDAVAQPADPHEPGRDAEVVLCAVDRFLDALTRPEHAAERAEILRVASQPLWVRQMRRLDAILSPRDPAPDDDKPLLGWRVALTADGVSVHPVRGREKKRGVGFVLRNEHVNDIPKGIAREPQDLLLLTLLAWPTATATTEAIEHLIGHPRVFAGDRSTDPLPVRRAGFGLRVAAGRQGLTVVAAVDGRPRDASFAPGAGCAWAGGRLVIVDADAIRVASVGPTTMELWAAFRRMGPIDPAGLPELLARLPALQAATPVDLDASLAGAVVPGDDRPLVRAAWVDDGLDVSAWVRPVPDAVPQVPGGGPPTLHVVRDGRPAHVARDLGAEPGRVRAALAGLGLPIEVGPFQWRVGGLEQALALVEALRDRASDLQIEWGGEVPRLGQTVTASAMRLRIDRGRDWFGLGGVALVDGEEVPLRALLDAAHEGAAYVRLASGAWSRVADALRARLADLAAAAHTARQGTPRLSPLHAPAVEALAEAGVAVEAPVDWAKWLGRLDEARALEAPVPDGLRAELRDYQVAGFRWLASLAHWAPGAVLADDMGLGKTVQAIALLLRRQATGPALVVCPTSVVANWCRELARFAPALAVHVHAGGDRRRELDHLGAGDVLVTSYGVALRDAELLSAVEFGTLVLDEAQAIKNPDAQRARAVRGLRAGFRLALSGTPVENHTGELWSVLDTVAPGLLGTWDRFRERFAVPIEGRNDLERRRQLAGLVRPFVLRRTKAQVARELPARIESVIEVELSDAERVLYDRARLDALYRVQALSGPTARVQVLAELTRLRQLACHPRLVDAGSVAPSSKLARAVELLTDLREAGHRALVFSQFTRHLDLVEAALSEAGLRLLRLDGSTPAAERVRRVDAFQRGEADAFLLSLGAGGVGLNLTAADYVVHLDPWWNPAKEDQATDRAHRIGQDKVVSVYRLVALGTIEEQIVALHGQKRDLADAILDETGTAARATTDDLVALLRDEPPPV